MVLTEEKLASSIKAGRLERVYFIYGKEPFLIQMYVDRIIKKAVGDDALDFNLQKLEGSPDPDVLSDYVDTLPVFSEQKVITVKDFEPAGRSTSYDAKYLDIVSNMPDTTVLVLYCINNEIDEKNARVKKLMAAVEKNGAVCCINMMQPPKIAELCVKKAAKAGIVLSHDDALFLTERVGGQMQSASDETAKLMNYVGDGGTITRDNICLLVPKQLEAVVYDLADAINSGKRADAYRITDELFKKRVTAVNIMTALSGAYLDLYCAKLAKISGTNLDDAAKAFGFYGKRVWVFTNRIAPAASRLGTAYLRETVRILSETDIALKSLPVDSRVLVDEAVTRLFMCREKIRQ